MRYSIMGFNQLKLMETNLDLTDLMILDYIITACGSTGMYHKLDTNGNPLVWISHSKFHDDLPFLRLSESTLKNRLSTLRQNGYIHSIVVASESGKGSRTYYGITEITTYLIKDVEDMTTYREKDVVELPRTAKSTSDSILKKDDKELNKDDIVEKFLESYNSICKSLPTVRKITDKRVSAIKRLYKDYSEDDILLVLKKTELSDFLSGRNGKWSATLDWILKDANFIKILEGNYDNRGSNNKFAENNKISSKKVTKEEIANGYFTNETY